MSLSKFLLTRVDTLFEPATLVVGVAALTKEVSYRSNPQEIHLSDPREGLPLSAENRYLKNGKMSLS